MDGEFICEDVFGTVKGVAGGNFLILAESQAIALAAAEAATDGDRAGARRDPAVPRRRGAQRVEGRQQVQGAAGQHERRLLPDASRRGPNGACRRA